MFRVGQHVRVVRSKTDRSPFQDNQCLAIVGRTYIISRVAPNGVYYVLKEKEDAEEMRGGLIKEDYIVAADHKIEYKKGGVVMGHEVQYTKPLWVYPSEAEIPF